MISTRAANRLSCLNPSGSVFAEYTALSNKHKSVNLGQGFPALPVAQFIKDAAKLAVENPGPFHQYTRSEGHPRLVNALSRFYEPLIKRSLDPMTEIVTTDGANEAIYSTMQAFINPGDEVILMEPFFDSYKASVELAGGVCVSVSMSQTGQRASDWKLNLVDLENSISSKTKMLILNNPHNPIGKVFTDKELGQLAQFAIRHDLLVLADEVYETLVFSDSTSPMIKFASLPGMYERTITVGSIGKMFGVTGWRTGFAIAPKELIRSIWMVHQYIPFSVTTPMQEAAASCLEQAQSNGFFLKMTKQYQELRDYLFKVLQDAGFKPMLPDGGYFIICDASGLFENGDEDLSKHILVNVGVTGIPLHPFYQNKTSNNSNLIRFAFCKEMSLLKEAAKRLQAKSGQ